MMGYLFGGMVIAAFFFGITGGQTEAVTAALFSGTKSAVDLALSLLGMMCFWSGLLEIARRSGLTEKIAGLLSPLMRLLFPRLSPKSPAVSAMVMNITANLLGLSNAATPLGLAAMKELSKINSLKDRASDEMCLFVVINSASLTLIPTTVITLRSAAGSSDPASILFPVWLSSLCSLFVGIMAAKLLAKRRKRP